MKTSMKNLTFILLAPVLILSLLPGKSSAADQLVASDEYSRTSVNTDLSQSIEYFPYPLFFWNQSTAKWEQKENVDITRGFVSYVSEANPNKNYSDSNEVMAGKDSSGNYETFINFGNSLPPLNGGLLIGAQLRLQEQGNDNSCYYCDNYYENQQYSIYKVTGSWNSGNITWTNKPATLGTPAAFKTKMMGTTSGSFSWDVSGLVSDWYENTSENHGLAIRSANQQDSTSLRTFHKWSSELRRIPVLQVNYSPKPSPPTAYGDALQQNSGLGYVSLNWNSVRGAKGYRVYMYNGKEYERVYDGPGTSWSSIGKNIWPTKEQISSGDYSIKRDGTGTELSNKPGHVYSLNGDEYSSPDTYYFRLSAYNDHGESGLSEIKSVKMPNSTPTSLPKNVKAVSESISDFTLTWDSVPDFEDIKYAYRITTPGGLLVSQGTTNSNRVTIPQSYLTVRDNYLFSVKSFNDSGFSSYSTPIQVTARQKLDSIVPRYSIPTGAHEAGWSPVIKVAMTNIGTEPWTKADGFTLKSELFSVELDDADVIRSGETKEFIFHLPEKMPLGSTTIKWQMYHRDSGYFGSSLTKEITYEDSVAPVISLLSPSDGDSVKGKVQLDGSVKDYQLSQYSISYQYAEHPDVWNIITSGNGSSSGFGVWDTTSLENGRYTLRIFAKDMVNHETIKDYNVTVKNPIAAPVVNEVTDQATVITGQAKPNTTVFVGKEGKTLGRELSGDTGSFNITIPKQQPNTKLYVYAIDDFVIGDVVTLNVKDVTAPDMPAVNPVTNKATAVTGKTEPKASVTVRIGTATYIKSADAEGKFSVGIPVQNSGMAIYVSVEDAVKLQSKERKIYVTRVAPNIPIVNSVNNKATVVTGTTEKYGSVYVVINGKTYYAKADSYGKYKVSIPIQNSGVSITVKVKDAAGNTSVSKSITVTRVAPNMPVVNAVRTYSTSVTGKTEKYAIVYVKIGTRTYSAKANSYGNFKVYIPKKPAGLICI